MNIEGRTVLLTGASGGIGGVIARTLHERGAALLVSGRRAEPLGRLCAELGERAEAVVADLAEPDAVASLADRARDGTSSSRGPAYRRWADRLVQRG